MLLAIDAGNTTIYLAVFEGPQDTKPKAQWFTYTKDKRTADEWAAWLGAMMQQTGLDLQHITHSIIACVVPDLLEDLQEFCCKYLSNKPLVIGDAGVKLNLNIKTDNPPEVGADLIAATAAAKTLYQPPLLILGMGTATTLSFVNADGDFAGVAIAPGVDLAIASLSSGTANLPPVCFGRPQKIIGTTTIPCIQAGIYWGYVGLVEGLITRAQKEHGDTQLPVIATGGHAATIAQETSLISALDSDLVLKGLHILFWHNHAQKIEAVA